MIVRKPRVLRVLLAFIILTSLSSGCMPTYYRFHVSSIPQGYRQVAEVTEVGSKEDISKHYKGLRSIGVSDQDIQNGGFGMGRVFCCGVIGYHEVYFHIPVGLEIEEGDVVEIVVGIAPDGNNPGQLNTVDKVRNKNGIESRACRYLPEDSMNKMRVIYCDWMATEGWHRDPEIPLVWYKGEK